VQSIYIDIQLEDLTRTECNWP